MKLFFALDHIFWHSGLTSMISKLCFLWQARGRTSWNTRSPPSSAPRSSPQAGSELNATQLQFLLYVGFLGQKYNTGVLDSSDSADSCVENYFIFLPTIFKKIPVSCEENDFFTIFLDDIISFLLL
jgi:hypothetical protein